MGEQKMREEFEAWAEDALGLPMNRLRTGGYQSFGMHNAWSAWQASREALVIDLADLNVQHASYNNVDCFSISDVKTVIEAAGIKVAQ